MNVSTRKYARPLYALLPGIDLNEFDFEPLPEPKHYRLPESVWLKRKAENRLAKLRKLKAEWDEQELNYLKMRAAQIAREIEEDKRWLKEFAAREEARRRTEEEFARVRKWFDEEHAKEAAKAKRT